MRSFTSVNKLLAYRATFKFTTLNKAHQTTIGRKKSYLLGIIDSLKEGTYCNL